MKRAKYAGRKKLSGHATGIAHATGHQTIEVPVPLPRNPFAPLARQRKAGPHGGSGRTRRQAEKRELRRQLDEK